MRRLNKDSERSAGGHATDPNQPVSRDRMTRLRRGSSALMRDLNRAAVLALIGQRGPIARITIARELALSPATVTAVTRDLVREGLVREVDQAPSNGGRAGGPPRPPAGPG